MSRFGGEVKRWQRWVRAGLAGRGQRVGVGPIMLGTDISTACRACHLDNSTVAVLFPSRAKTFG
jgi:hypothetical protein